MLFAQDQYHIVPMCGINWGYTVAVHTTHSISSHYTPTHTSVALSGKPAESLVH